MLTHENKDMISRILVQEISKPSLGTLTLKEAREIAELARRKALMIGVPIVVAIADMQGQLILFHRMESSLPASSQLAMDKAHTAATFRMTTEQLGKLAQPGEMLFGVQANNGGRVVIFGGGIPFHKNGAVVGAIGVSGGTAFQDVEIAAWALDNFSNEIERCSEKGQDSE